MNTIYLILIFYVHLLQVLLFDFFFKHLTLFSIYPCLF
jgi:hypothetical protein